MQILTASFEAFACFLKSKTGACFLIVLPLLIIFAFLMQKKDLLGLDLPKKRKREKVNAVWTATMRRWPWQPPVA